MCIRDRIITENLPGELSKDERAVYELVAGRMPVSYTHLSVLGAFGGLLGGGASGGDEPQDTAGQKRKKKKNRTRRID